MFQLPLRAEHAPQIVVRSEIAWIAFNHLLIRLGCFSQFSGNVLIVVGVCHVWHVDRGEILFDVGDTNIPFFVILSGSMEVVQPGLLPTPTPRGKRQLSKTGESRFGVTSRIPQIWPLYLVRLS